MNILIIFNIKMYRLSPNGDQLTFRGFFLNFVGPINNIRQFFPFEWEVFT
jgi:hypothetical protein